MSPWQLLGWGRHYWFVIHMQLQRSYARGGAVWDVSCHFRTAVAQFFPCVHFSPGIQNQRNPNQKPVVSDHPEPPSFPVGPWIAKLCQGKSFSGVTRNQKYRLKKNLSYIILYYIYIIYIYIFSFIYLFMLLRTCFAKKKSKHDGWVAKDPLIECHGRALLQSSVQNWSWGSGTVESVHIYI